MNQIHVPALVPAPTSGNLTDLVADRAHFEPERVMLSRPLGEGWQEVAAGSFISLALPLIVFFALQRYFVRGLTAGAVK